jgi:hypothetical protein
MVSLESKIVFQSRIHESVKLTAFNNLLSGKPFVNTDPAFSNETDEIFFGIVKALHENNKSLFEEHYTKKRKSNPTKESSAPFVNDDFLIFCLIVGIFRYDEDKSWIKNIISLRSRSAITITFENLVNENYSDKNNLPQIVLMYFKQNNPSGITGELLSTTWKSINENTFLFDSRSEFDIVCTLRAYDLIIELKDFSSGSEMVLLKEFNSRFLKRAKVISLIAQTILICGIIYLGFMLVSLNPEVDEYAKKMGDALKILSMVGLSQIGNFIPALTRTSYKFILRIMGYPKELRNKAIEKKN